VAFGIHNIWFILDRANNLPLARALGLSIGAFLELLEFGGFLIPDEGLKKISEIQDAIGIKIGSDTVKRAIGDTGRKKYLYIISLRTSP